MTSAGEHSYLETHALRGPALRLCLTEQAESLLEDARNSAAGRSAQTLAKEGPLRVVLLAMTAGSYLSEHRVEAPASVQVLSGVVEMPQAPPGEPLVAGDLLVLDAGVPHSLLAISDSTLVLTIALAG